MKCKYAEDHAYETEASDAEASLYRALHAKPGSGMQAQANERNIGKERTDVSADNEYDDSKRSKIEDQLERREGRRY